MPSPTTVYLTHGRELSYTSMVVRIAVMQIKAEELRGEEAEQASAEIRRVTAQAASELRSLIQHHVHHA